MAEPVSARRATRMVRRGTTRLLRERLRDERSGRVVFVSHCLLNENVRYLGGATRPGCVDEIVDGLRRQGVGICQMPCPEQRAWGGVLKRDLLLAYGLDRTPLGRLRGVVARLFLGYTRLRYARLARRIADEIADYGRSGFAVAGVVGIDGSPSCGVTRTLAIGPALRVIASCDPATVEREVFNRRAILANVVPGPGLFTTALQAELSRRRLAVDLFAHDLVAELEGRSVAPIELRAIEHPAG